MSRVEIGLFRMMSFGFDTSAFVIVMCWCCLLLNLWG